MQSEVVTSAEEVPSDTGAQPATVKSRVNRKQVKRFIRNLSFCSDVLWRKGCYQNEALSFDSIVPQNTEKENQKFQ